MSGPNKTYRASWQRRISLGSVQASVFSTFCVAAAGLVHWGLGLITEDTQVFTTFYPAVLFATLVGGANVGIYAAILSAVVAWWAFMLAGFTFSLPTSDQAISLLIYLYASLLIVWAADRYRKLTRRLEDEERFRKLAVEELAHRLRNKIATIQAIISLELPDIPQRRRCHYWSSCRALSATDNLILQTQGKGARLREILTTELGPYTTSRIAIAGPVILLAPNLAMTMALLVHELATNAVKYGALSSATGQVAISWSLSNKRLYLEWRESGGPAVSAPTESGFGTQLLSRALVQFDGAVETSFEATGLLCKMSVMLSANAISGSDGTAAGEQIVGYG